MSYEKLGSDILEAIALKGQVSGSEKKLTEISASIAKNESEIAHLKGLEVETAKMKLEQASTAKSLETMKDNLNRKLQALKVQGADIDFGKASGASISI